MKCLVLAFFFMTMKAGAQQNLFNIPSGEITSDGEFFYQHQLNLYRANTPQSKQHFVFGWSDALEVGVNVMNVAITEPKTWSGRNRPLVAMTAQKSWVLDQQFFLNLGTQVGSVIMPRNTGELFTAFNYGLLGYRFANHHSRLIVGAYSTTNEVFLEGPDRAGALFGYEIFLTQRFGLMGDFISGQSRSSASVVGFIYSFSKHLQLCIGALLPNSRNPAQKGIVIELNAFTFEAY
ncbi:MAG: hypothetical protein K2X47_04495 [Bdellovibrionales bacterium]|nr:hypothetical protein [Bdellovibrionales bacterium]